MKLFVAVVDDYALLPHFLKHYRGLGVDQIFIATEPSVHHGVIAVARHFGSVVRDDLDVRDSMTGGTAAVSEMRQTYAGEDEWVMVADLDEFAVLPFPLREVVRLAEAEGANLVRGRMIDRVAAGGVLPQIWPDTDLWSTFPHQARLTSRLQGSVDYKGVVVRGRLKPAMAHHEFHGERIASTQVELHHFKWSASVAARTERVMMMARDAGIHWWTEYERLLLHVRMHGRIRWEDFV